MYFYWKYVTKTFNMAASVGKMHCGIVRYTCDGFIPQIGIVFYRLVLANIGKTDCTKWYGTGTGLILLNCIRYKLYKPIQSLTRPMPSCLLGGCQV